MYAECHKLVFNGECHYAECRCAKCRRANENEGEKTLFGHTPF